MKPERCHLETRQGNWVVVLSNGKARPATKTELYLWLQLLELRKVSDEIFDIAERSIRTQK